MSSAADGAVGLAPESLADALGVDVDVLENALVDVGVDADYLARAVYDGDPQGVLADVGARLDVARSDVVVAVVKALVDADRVPELVDAAFTVVQDPPVVRARVELAQASRSGDEPVNEVVVADASPDEEILARFLEERLPRLTRRVRVATAGLGAGCVALGVAGFVWPGAFRTAVWVLAAGGFVVVGAGFMAAAWRLNRVTRALTAFASELRRTP